MEDLKPVYIVSLGPGEAGLISLIGGATLCRANAIFCPKTNARSRSSVLLKELKIKKESIRRYTLPMSKKREMAYEAYAFIAAAASIGLSIVEQEERLTVCPGKVDGELFSRIASGSEVAVVMKLSQCEGEVKHFISLEERLVCHYFENVGADGEFYTCDKKDILAREFPYFSLMIIKGR